MQQRVTRPLLCSLLIGLSPLPAGAEEAVAVTASAPARAAEEGLKLVRRERAGFDTQVQIIAVAKGEADARRVAAHVEAAFAEIERVARLVDPANPQADLGQLSAEAGKGAVLLTPELFAMLVEARRLATLTQGAFDPTFAALDEVWRFTPEGEVPLAPPADEALEQARLLVGYKELLLDEGARKASLAREGQRVGLSGLARGWALDRAAALLEERGVKSFVIAAGGDVVVRGQKGDEPWMVGVQDPRAPGHFAAFAADRSMAVMTTGDYERFFFAEERRYHHVLDPRTGRPAAGARSVTVLAPEGATADALSTAVFVLGPVEGLALVERLKGVEALIVTDDNRVLHSKGLKNAVRYRPPTDAP